MKTKILISAVVIGVGIFGSLAAMRRHAGNQQKALHGACISNLRLLDSVKEQFAIPRKLSAGTEVSWDNIKQFLPAKASVPLDCPAGGKYTLNPIGEDPACSRHGTLTEAIEGKHKNN